MCQLCAALSVAPQVCPYESTGYEIATLPQENDNVMGLQQADVATVVQYQSVVSKAELGLVAEASTAITTVPMRISLTASELELVSAMNTLFEEYFSTRMPAAVVVVEPERELRVDYLGSFLPANLTGPLTSIDWGWQVADQNPDTPSTDINVYFHADFDTVVDPYYPADGLDNQSWTAAEIAAATDVLERFENVIDINFVVVDDLIDADFVMLTYYDPDAGDLGFFGLSDRVIRVDGVEYDVNGYGAFNINGYGWSDEGLQPGGYGHTTITHEIGHGLGLGHPHDTSGGATTIMDGVTSPFDDYGDYSLNQGIWTVMSYNDGWPEGPHGLSASEFYGHGAGPMALDIAVLQDTFGANTSFAGGDDIYYLPSRNDIGTSFQAIWDTGGTDTIAASDDRGVHIDLTPASLDYSATGGGAVSYARGIIGGFTIANGVVIENAVGGSGEDTLIGNAADNVLSGNNGNDTLDGRGGNDTLEGGAGQDTFVFSQIGGADSNFDVIVDFNISDDTLQLDALGINNLSDFYGVASETGADVFVFVDTNNTLTIENITITQLSDDIAFV